MQTTYEEILNTMVDKYCELSGYTVSEESDIMLRLKVLAGEIYTNSVASEFLKRQMFPTTASGEYLDNHALERGLIRKEAVKATGEVTFSVAQASDTDIVIEQGTVVSTSGDDVKQFVTDETVTLSAGSLSITVEATAVNGGTDYNVLQNTITVLVTPPTGITGVTNAKVFKGGVDKESDDELRNRVLYSYQDISNGTNAVYYKRLAQSVPGVYSASVISQARGAGTVDVHICGKGSATVNKDHIAQVQQLLDENRELNVDVEVLYANAVNTSFTFEIEVEDGYSFDELCTILTEKITEYIDSLGVGKPALLCDLGDIIYHTDGVKNYEFLTAFCDDVDPSEKGYCVASEIDIRERS